MARSVMTCDLTHNSKHVVQNLLQRFPITSKERTELLPQTERAVFTSPDTGGESPSEDLCHRVSFLVSVVRFISFLQTVRTEPAVV